MTNSSQSFRYLLTIVACILLGVAGCSSDDADSDKQAARDNADAMSQEHASDTSEPSPATTVEPSQPVESERFAYAEVNEEVVYGYFVAPSNMIEPLPAIIMIHEWWGLNDNVRAMADRLAGEGYIVLAVDLYGGETAEFPQDARELMLKVVEDPDSASDNLRQAYQFVTTAAGAPRVASLGWCFGGAWSLNTAMLFPDELDAAVIYYGQVTADEDKLRPVNVPILGLFGAADRGISVESVNEFEAALQRLRKVHDIQIYPGAGHAFANPTGRNYDADVAQDAWQRTLEFLGQNLTVAEEAS